MKKTKLYIAALLLLLTLSAVAAFCLYIYQCKMIAGIFVILFLIILFFLYRIIIDIYRDFSNYVAAFYYRDFSQKFSVARAPLHLKIFRGGFNTIVEEYKKLNFEKALQYQYLQNVL